MPAYLLATPPSRVREDGGGGTSGLWPWKGPSTNCQLLMHLRERKAPGQLGGPPPRKKNPIVQPRGLGTGRSIDLQADAHVCQGQAWPSALGPVRRGGGDNPRGGQPHCTFILEDVNPSPDAAIDILSTDGHRMKHKTFFICKNPINANKKRVDCQALFSTYSAIWTLTHFVKKTVIVHFQGIASVYAILQKLTAPLVVFKQKPLSPILANQRACIQVRWQGYFHFERGASWEEFRQSWLKVIEGG